MFKMFRKKKQNNFFALIPFNFDQINTHSLQLADCKLANVCNVCAMRV